MRNLKRALSLALASVMLVGMMVVGSSAASFPDVDSNDNIEAIDVLETVEVMIGNENGDFEPDKNVTRAEMAVVMAKLLNLDYKYYETTCPFNDVPDWAKGWVGACAANGIVSGRGEGVYDPNATVTAVEAASMMMRALGYFQNSEDYKGGFEAATVKQASQISLFSGIGGNAKDALNRNQVAKLTLNALEANMVDFTGDMGFEANGISIGYRSEYTVRTGTEKKYAALSSLGDTTSVEGSGAQGRYYIQLGEELYDGKLTKRTGTGNPDDFGRPATTWRYDGKDIGTYAHEADLSYTKSVKISDIYKDLGLGSTVEAKNVTVYVDGVEDAAQPARSIRKNDTSNSYGANGVLTEVFYIKSNRADEDNRIVITEINTYTGEISKTVAATDKKDAYVVVALESEKPAGVGGSLNFETDVKFDDETRVLYTYSRDSEEMKSLAVAETLSGDATRVDNKATNLDENKAIYIEETPYKFSKKSTGVQLGEVSVGNGYDLYLDQYGYVIYVNEIDEIGDYALVLNAQDKSDFSGNRALLVFADGTEKVVSTDKNYKKGGSNKNAIEPGTIVTYREDDGVYTLKPVQQNIGSDLIANGAPQYTSGGGVTTEFKLENSKAGVTFHSSGANKSHYVYDDPGNSTAKTTAEKITDSSALVVNANSSTIFVVFNDTDDVYSVYTGIKNVPTIEAASNKEVVAYSYSKPNSTMAQIMFIFVKDGSAIKDDSKNLLFLAGASVSDLIHTKQGDYFEYNAVVNDEVTTVKVADDVTVNGVKANKLNGLFASYTVDKNDIITGLTKYTAFNNSTDAKQALDGGTGIDKRSADYTVIMDTANKSYTVTVDEKANIYAVDEDGKITESTYRAISKDSDDKVYAVVQDWLVKHLFIQEVNPTDDAAAPTGSITPAGAQTVAKGGELKLTAAMSVSDKGELSYQWYKHTTNTLTLDNISTATKLAGETGKELTVKGETEGDEFYYYCVVTNTNEKVNGKSETETLVVSGKITTGKSYAGEVGVRVTYKAGSSKVGAESVAVPVDIAGFGELTEDMLTAPEFYKFTDSAFNDFPKEVDKNTVGTLAVEVAVELDKKGNVPESFTKEDLTALVAGTKFEGVEAIISTDLTYKVDDDGKITFDAAKMKAFKKDVTQEDEEVLKALNTFWFGNDRKDEWKTSVADMLDTLDNFYGGGVAHTAFIAVYIEDHLSIIPVRGATPSSNYSLSSSDLRGTYTIDFSKLTWPTGY